MAEAAKQDQRPMKWRRWTVVAVSAVLLVAIGTFLIPAVRVWLRDSLGLGWSGVPDPGEVESMRAMLGNSPHGLPNLPLFEVPRESIPAILQALRPYQRDPLPARWQGLGTLYLARQGGGQFRIDLYWTKMRQGAFASGPTFKWRTYYRGGTDQGIEDAIRAAYHRRLSQPPSVTPGNGFGRQDAR
jgi:hypothetical protein